jgi:hypothetical protein
MSPKESNPYHYSLQLELALAEFFGYESKWNGSAHSFENVRYVRKALLAVVTKIKKRIAEIITVDDRLLTATNVTVDAIEGEAKILSNEQNSLLEIVAFLLHLVAYLLGYDWLRGKPNRHVIYYQTADQELIDDKAQHPDAMNLASKNKEDYKRYEIVNELYEEKFRVAEIARIMKLTEPMIRDMLKDAGKL